MAVGMMRPISVASCSGPLGSGRHRRHRPRGPPPARCRQRGMEHGRHGAEDLPDLHRATEFIGCRSAGSRRIVEHAGEDARRPGDAGRAVSVRPATAVTRRAGTTGRRCDAAGDGGLTDGQVHARTPARESWRLAIGVEPACAAWPVKMIGCRSTPNVPARRSWQASPAPAGRALLDVELEVGRVRRSAEAAAPLAASTSTLTFRECVGQRDPIGGRSTCARRAGHQGPCGR